MSSIISSVFRIADKYLAILPSPNTAISRDALIPFFEYSASFSSLTRNLPSVFAISSPLNILALGVGKRF